MRAEAPGMALLVDPNAHAAATLRTAVGIFRRARVGPARIRAGTRRGARVTQAGARIVAAALARLSGPRLAASVLAALQPLVAAPLVLVARI